MLYIGWTTVGRREDAQAMSQALILQKLAACVQVEGPIVSHYSWEGKIEQSEEFRLTLKFLPAQAKALETWIMANHPYETPEWVVVRAEIVGEKYLSWARANSTAQPL